jgi:tetratricopeptide (TPR) repeat protein
MKCRNTTIPGTDPFPAYYVEVGEAADGRKSFHSCASVFCGDGALLIDPTYLWFGAPHRSFAILNDAQATAIFISSLHDLDGCEVALQIAPQLMVVQLNLFETEISQGRWFDAANIMTNIEAISPHHWVSYVCQANYAAHEGNFDGAIKLFEVASGLTPDTGAIYLQEGDIYLNRGEYAKARELYSHALKCTLLESQIKHIDIALLDIHKMELQIKFDTPTNSTR